MSGALLPLALSITGTITAIDFDGYAGHGLDPSPDDGQLDSDDWRVTGMNDGDTSFGGSFTDGDHAEGSSSGGETDGGLWAFEVLPDDPAFGFQQTGDDLTPGSIFLRLINQTGETILQPTFGYEGWVHNDASRSTVVEVSWSVDGAAFLPIAALELTSPEAADASPAWEQTLLVGQLTGVVIPPGGELYLRWSPDDNGGTGGYDEIAIDDIVLVIGDDDPPPPPDETPDAGQDVPDEPDAGQGVPDEPKSDDGDDGYVAYGCAAGGEAGVGAGAILLGLLAVRRRRRID